MTTSNVPSFLRPLTLATPEQSGVPDFLRPLNPTEKPEEKGFYSKWKERVEGEKVEAEKKQKEFAERHPQGLLGSLFTKEGRNKIEEDFAANVEEPGRKLLSGAVREAKRNPIQMLKESPGAISGILEGVVDMFLKLPIEEQNRLSTQISEKMREGLSPEQAEGAESINKLEQVLLPFLTKYLPKGKTVPQGPKEPGPLFPRKPTEPPPPPVSQLSQSIADRMAMPEPKSLVAETLKGMEGPPSSEPGQMYALREQMIKEMAPGQAKPLFQAQISPQPMEGGKPLAGRITQPKEIEKPLGTSELRLHPGEAEPINPERVEQILPKKEGEVPDFAKGVSKNRIETKAEGGELPANKIKTEAKAERDGPVDAAYKGAEQDTKNFNSMFPEIAEENEKLISDLELIQERNAGEKAVYQQALNIRKMIGGNTTELPSIEANALKLMKQSDSMTQMANFETPYTGVRGRIKTLSSAINKGVIKRMNLKGLKTERVEAADKIYSKWADTYLNDEIEPFMKYKILDPEKNFESLIKNEGTYRAVKNVLKKRDPSLLAKIDRAVLESKFQKYHEKPELIGSHQYNQDLADAKRLIGVKPVEKVNVQLKKHKAQGERKTTLEARINEREKATPSEKGAKLSEEEKVREKRLKERITGYTREVAKEPEARIKISPQPKAEKVEATSQKLKQLKEDIEAHKNLKPEDFDGYFKDKTSIRLFRDKMKRMNREDIFKKEAVNATDNFFRDGLHERPKIMGHEARDIINKNYDVLSELWGRETTNEALAYFTMRAKKEFISQALKKLMQKVGLLSVGGGAAGKAMAGTTGKIISQALESAE